MQSSNKLGRIIMTMSFLLNILFFVIGIVFIARTDIAVLRVGMLEYGIIAPVSYIVVYIGLFILPYNPVSRAVLTYFALVSFGPWNALLYTVFANTIGATINFVFAKEFLLLLPETDMENLKKFASKRGWWVLLINRITPIIDGFAGADIPSYIAGIAKMPYAIFISVTIGIWTVLDIIYFFALNIFLMEPAFMGIIVALMIFSLSISVLRLLEKR